MYVKYSKVKLAMNAIWILFSHFDTKAKTKHHEALISSV